MARLKRFCPVGIAQHVIQRGNNRQVEMHAWVFMTNHAHLLMTPQKDHGISQMMQTLGRQYVRYYNYTYKRSGTLWEGRFKSCLVQMTNTCN